MNINFSATKGRFEEACLSQKKYAEKHGFQYALFTQVLNGTYPSMNTPRAVAVIDHLRKAGFLVEEQTCETKAA